MNLVQLNKKVKAISETKELEIALFKYIKNDIPHILLQYNINQLFYDSEGADGISLGYYGYNNPDPLKKPGDPFTMIESGGMMASMKISVTAGDSRRGIRITSDIPYLNKIESSPYFVTTNFFGLTEDNMNNFIKKWIKPFLQKWIKEKLLT